MMKVRGLHHHSREPSEAFLDLPLPPSPPLTHSFPSSPPLHHTHLHSAVSPIHPSLSSSSSYSCSLLLSSSSSSLRHHLHSFSPVPSSHSSSSSYSSSCSALSTSSSSSSSLPHFTTSLPHLSSPSHHHHHHSNTQTNVECHCHHHHHHHNHHHHHHHHHCHTSEAQTAPHYHHHKHHRHASPLCHHHHNHHHLAVLKSEHNIKPPPPQLPPPPPSQLPPPPPPQSPPPSPQSPPVITTTQPWSVPLILLTVMMAVTPVTPSSTDATHSGDLHLTRGTNIHSLAWAIKVSESCHLPQILSDFKTSNAKFQPSQYCGEDVPRKLIILKHLLPFDNVYLVAHPFYKLFSKYRRVMRQRNRRETLRNFTTSHDAVREKLHNVTTPHSTKVSPHFPKHQSRSTQRNRKNLMYFTHTTTVSLQDRDVVFRRVERCVGQYLASHPCLAYAHQEVLRPRKKRSSLEFEDPLYNEQWHLSNPVPGQYDINVGGVWESGITGRGVTVCVIDDGLEWRHPDLRKNYSPAGSYDLNSDDPDPSPVKNGERNEHGTRCAGEIAAVANSVCGVGVAFHANISGIRVLGERMTDSMEAAAFVQGLTVNDIYSCSWGPDDDGRTVDGPHHLAREALKHGVTYGRGGYGAIYVVASGNGGRNKDNCNFDGYANSVYTVTIGAVDSHGRMPYYAEECAAMLAVTPSSGTKGRDIVTTDWQEISASGCTKHHSGTSAAAPLAAAVIALALEVQPCLSWRDVQHLIALTSRKIDANNPDWSSNGAGLHHSHQHGFGLMDAAAMVSSAAVWESVPFSTTYSTPLMVEDLAIPAERMQGVTVRCEVDQSTLGSYALATLEFVQVQVSLQHQYRGSLKIVLVCPSGTRSTLAAPREADNSSKGLNEWSLGTVRCWGEAAAGVYQVTVTQTRHQHLSGRLTSWRLVLHGSSLTTHQFQDRRRLVERVQRGEVIHVNRSTLCHPPELRFKPFHPLPDKWLKVLAVTSLFLLVMVAFNTLEYIFCYNDEKERFYRRLRDVAAGRALQHRRNTSGSLVGRLGPPGDSAAYGSVVGGVEGDTIGQCASQSPASYEILPLMSEGAREAALVSPSPSCDADVSSFGADEDDSDEDGLSSHCTSDTVLPKDTDATDFTNDEFFSEVDEERLVSGVSGGGLLLGGKVDKVEVQEEEEDEEEEVFVRDSIMGGGVMGRRDVVHVDLWAER